MERQIVTRCVDAMDRLRDPVAWLGRCHEHGQHAGDHRDPTSRVRPGGHGQDDGNGDDNRDTTDMLGNQEAQRRAAYRSYLGGDSARIRREGLACTFR